MRTSSRNKSKSGMALDLRGTENLDDTESDHIPQIPVVRKSGRIETRRLALSTALASNTFPPNQNEQLEDDVEIVAESDNETISDRVHSRRRRSSMETAVVQTGSENINTTLIPIIDTINDNMHNDVILHVPVIEYVDIYRESYVFPAVRGLPSSEIVHTLFVKVFGLLIRHMYYMQIKQNNDMRRAIYALNFLPCIMRYKRGQRHHLSIIKDLNLIIGIDSFDTVENSGFYNGVNAILKIRKDWIIRNRHESAKHFNITPNISRVKRTQNALFHTKNGQFSKALDSLSNCNSHVEIFDKDGNILHSFQEKLKKLFPEEDLSNIEYDHFASEERDSYTVTPGQVLFQITIAKRGSSSGLCAWTFEIFKILVKNDIRLGASNFINYMTQLCNLFLSGEAGNSDWWLNTQLVCIPKPDNNLRPIGIQNVFVRLSSSALGKVVSDEIFEKLKEQNQFGIGVANGCESIAHYAIACGEKIRLGISQEKVLIKLDIANAFNEVYRSAMRSAIMKECPRLISFYDFAYHSPTKLYSKDGTFMIEATRGTIQGNGLSGLLFCLAQRTAVMKTLERCAGVEIVSQYDDSFLFGTAEACSLFFVEFEKQLFDIGLRIKREECKVISGGIDVSCLPHEIKRVESFKAVGVPVGDEEFVNEFLEQKKTKTIRAY